MSEIEDSDESQVAEEEDVRHSVRVVKNLMKKRVKVLLTDGRLLIGGLYCLDQQGNILLSDAVELWKKKHLQAVDSAAETDVGRIALRDYIEQRSLNIVMIPKRFRASVRLHKEAEY